MGQTTDEFFKTIVTSYHDVLQFEETKKKYSRTTTSFRSRNAMEWLYKEGDKSCSEIADYLRISRPSATTMINKLEQLNYIYRYPSETDGRSDMVGLTRRGRLVTSYQVGHRDKMLSAVVSEFSQEELEIIHKGFKRLNEVFEGCCEQIEDHYNRKINVGD